MPDIDLGQMNGVGQSCRSYAVPVFAAPGRDGSFRSLAFNRLMDPYLVTPHSVTATAHRTRGISLFVRQSSLKKAVTDCLGSRRLGQEPPSNTIGGTRPRSYFLQRNPTMETVTAKVLRLITSMQSLGPLAC